MPLQEQILPLDFGQGVETKTDRKLVVPGKMLRLENAVFTTAKRISKRNGYAKLGTTTAPKMVHDYNGELISADQGRLLSYSDAESNWVDRGAYVSTDITRSSVDQNNIDSGVVDCAVLGKYALYSWSTATNTILGVFPTIFGSVVDLETGTVLAGPQKLNTTATAPEVKCVNLGGVNLAVYYLDNIGTVVFRLIDFTSGVPSFGVEQSLATLEPDPITNIFDIRGTATGAVIAGRVIGGTTGIQICILNNVGIVAVNADSASYVVPVFDIKNLALSITSNGDIWTYNDDNNFTIHDNYSVYGLIVSPTLVVIQPATLLFTAPDPFFVSQIVPVSDSATQQSVYIGTYKQTNFGVVVTYIDFTSKVTFNTGGVVGGPTNYAAGVVPFSKPFVVAGKTYVVFLYRGGKLSVTAINLELDFTEQPTYFLVQLDASPLVVGRFGGGVAASQAVFNKFINYSIIPVGLTATKFLFPCGIELQGFQTDFFVISPAFKLLGVLSGLFSYQFDFDSLNSYRAVNSGELSILNGGVLQQYDGLQTVELGFHVPPEITEIAVVAGAGIAIGTYTWIAIFQWTDDQGNLHQSAPSLAITRTTLVAASSIDVTITAPYLSQKRNMAVALFRTKSLGSTPFLVSPPLFFKVVNSPIELFITISDTLTDAQLDGNPQPYAYPSSPVLENGATPPAMITLSHNNRLWLVDSEETNTIWYTKSFSPGTGLSPSPFLIDQIDPKLGSITALEEMDEKIIIFKERGMSAQSGDGANDVGGNSTLSFPQFLPTDVGCSEMKSTVPTAKGIMFKSLSGIYMIDRGLNVVYVGLEVERYNSQVITSANFIPSKSQIRFLCSTGLTLVYDYVMQQWATFTAHTGLSATVFGNLYTYAATSGKVLKETPGLYLDDTAAFSLLAQSSWLALASVQGFERVRRLAMLGDFTNGASGAHRMQISAAYDFIETFSTPIPFTFGAAVATGPFQYRERLPRQKCDSLSLLIEEVTTGNALEYVDFTNLSLEVAVKRGVNKLPAGQSVG